jgi:electron transport complex protein RnfG
MSNVTHLLEGFIEGLNARRPALFNVYAACQPEHGVADDAAMQQSKLAVESRAYPLFRYDPGRGTTLVECCDVDGNPAVDADWPTYPLKYVDAQGGEAVMEVPMTFADFALTEGRRLAVERAVLRVLPGAVRQASFVVTPDGGPQPAADGASGQVVHAANDAQGGLVGVAMEGAARGYADLVRVLFAYAPSCQCIVGYTVLQMSETPGLGDKVLTDPAFLANFKALDATLDAAGTALAHPIQTVKHGSKQAPWEIDAITGVTITSKAIGRGIDGSAQRYVPIIQREVDVLGGTP